MVDKQIRLNYLDSIRGLAAIAVAFFHYILFYQKEINLKSGGLEYFVLKSFQNQFDLGKIAVLLFFMLSGFVITFSIKGEGVKTVKSFCLSRFFRLYPAYWFSLFLGWFYYSPSFKTVLVNMTMLQQFFGVKNVIGLYWTLQLEMIFYFMIVIMIYFNLHKKIKIYYTLSLSFLFIALGLSYLRMILVIKLPVAFPLAMSLMCFGAVFKSFSVESKDKQKVFVYLMFFLILIPIISKLAYDIDFGFHESWTRYLISYYLAIILFISFNFLKISNRILNYLGRISYSIYLFHPITYKIMQSFLIEDLSVIIKILINIMFLIIFSSVVYYFLEKPMILIGKKMKMSYLSK